MVQDSVMWSGCGPDQVILAGKLGCASVDLQGVCVFEGKLGREVKRKPQHVKAHTQVGRGCGDAYTHGTSHACLPLLGRAHRKILAHADSTKAPILSRSHTSS